MSARQCECEFVSPDGVKSLSFCLDDVAVNPGQWMKPLVYADPTTNSETEIARLKSDLECEKVEHAECCETVARLDEECVESAAKIRALLSALEKMTG